MTYIEAYKMAAENPGLIIISKATKDKYKIDKIKDKYIIKFYSSVLDSWRKAKFLLSEELEGEWEIYKEADKK